MSASARMSMRPWSRCARRFTACPALKSCIHGPFSRRLAKLVILANIRAWRIRNAPVAGGAGNKPEAMMRDRWGRIVKQVAAHGRWWHAQRVPCRARPRLTLTYPAATFGVEARDISAAAKVCVAAWPSPALPG
jgi:hypothetical protein